MLCLHGAISSPPPASLWPGGAGLRTAHSVNLDPLIVPIVLKEGDRVLVCSDGLWEVLSDAEIHAVIESDGSMRQLATQLVDRANRSGGTDNITVVLYEHRRAAA
jgi:PPM family protein phosphatase